MKIIAHRGLTNKYIKENTLSAFKNAINKNFDGIELDIRYTKDKKIVVHHDYLINRTSNGIGRLNSYTYKELKKFNFGTTHKKEKIPLLIDVLKKIKNKIIIIELKDDINIELLNILNKYKNNIYYICSFKNKYIHKFKNKNYKVGLINNIYNNKINLKELNFIIIYKELFNEKLFNKYNKNNIEIFIYNRKNIISIKNKEILNKINYII